MEHGAMSWRRGGKRNGWVFLPRVVLYTKCGVDAVMWCFGRQEVEPGC